MKLGLGQCGPYINIRYEVGTGAMRAVYKHTLWGVGLGQCGPYINIRYEGGTGSMWAVHKHTLWRV